MQIKRQDAEQPGTADDTAVAAPRKLTRKERNALNRARAEAVQAATYIAERLKAGEAPTEAFMAKACHDTLRAELPKVAAITPQDAASQHQLATVAAAVGLSEQVAAAVAAAAARSDLGRPEEYTEEEASRICQWIASGKSLRSYQRTTGRDIATVYSWMRKHPSFLVQYALAREDRADTLADEVQEIADEAAAAPSIEAVAAAKLRIDTRKWIAEKLNPRRYGQQINIDKQERVSFHLGIAPRPVQGRSTDVTDVSPVQTLQVTDATKPKA